MALSTRQEPLAVQMYKVNFNSQRGRLVEVGTFLVCAANAEAAQDMVAGALNIPPGTAKFEAVRVKPSIYELRRSEFRVTDAHGMGADNKNDDPGAVHEISTSAKVFAYSESAALRRLAGALIDSASAGRAGQPKHVNDLAIDIQRVDQRPRPSRIEEQSIYRETRFFQGGAVRPR